MQLRTFITAAAGTAPAVALATGPGSHSAEKETKDARKEAMGCPPDWATGYSIKSCGYLGYRGMGAGRSTAL